MVRAGGGGVSISSQAVTTVAVEVVGCFPVSQMYTCSGLFTGVLAVLQRCALVVGVSVVWQATTVARGAGSGQERRWTFVILCCGRPAAILIY